MLSTLDFTALSDLHQLDRPLIWLQDSKSPISMLLNSCYVVTSNMMGKDEHVHV